MQKIKIADLKDHPENSYYFDEMSGQKWEEFKESIRTSGVLEPVIVTQDLIIVSGHQRKRACFELDIDEITCDIKHYADRDGRTKEDWITKDLIETNVRQRGDVGGSELKAIHRVDALRRIYGIGHGGDRKSAIKSEIFTLDNDPQNMQEVAEAAGFTYDLYKQYSKLRDLIPEIQDMFERGEVTACVASKVLARLSPDEQYELVEKLPAAEKLTMKIAEQYAALIQDKQNEYTSESAQMAVKLEKQVKKNADNEELIAALKRQGDPDLVAEIEKLKAQTRKDYERGQQYKEEAERARRRAEQAEERAARDRQKLDEAAAENYGLLEQLEQLQDKLGVIEGEQAPPVVAFTGNPYTINTLLREMSAFCSTLDSFLGNSITANKKDAGRFDESLRDIVTKLGSIKNLIAGVA